MYSTSNRKQPCRFFLQGKCNRGNSCKWSHDLAGDVNYPNTNLNGPRTSNLVYGHGVHRSQSTDTAAGPVSATTGEAFPRIRAPSLPRPVQARGRETDNASNRGGGSRGRGRRGRLAAKEKGKEPAHAISFDPQRNEEQGTNCSNPGASSAPPYRLGSRGRTTTCPVILGDRRGRGEGNRGGSTGMQRNTGAVGDVVDTMKKLPWNVNVRHRAPHVFP